MSIELEKIVYGTKNAEYIMCCKFATCIKHLEAKGYIHKDRVVHIPNGQRSGSKTSRIIAGGKDKAMGAIAGAADYSIAGVGYLEAKIYNAKGKTYQSKSQKEFEKNALAMGLKYEVFRTPAEGIRTLCNWGVINMPFPDMLKMLRIV